MKQEDESWIIIICDIPILGQDGITEEKHETAVIDNGSRKCMEKGVLS